MSSIIFNSLGSVLRRFLECDNFIDSKQAIPERYSKHKLDPIDEFFAMGRGHQKPQSGDKAAVDVPSLVRG